MTVESRSSPIKVSMFGPHLDAMSGISAVVRNWQSAQLEQHINLRYVSTLDFNGPGRRGTKLLNAIRAYFRAMYMSRSNTQVVHIHVSSNMSFYRKLVIHCIARMKRLPIISHLHGSEFREFYAAGSAVQKRLIRYFFERSAIVLTLSQSWTDFINEIAPGARTRILYNSAPISLYAGSGNASESIRILFMGTLGDRKGTPDLIEAFRRVAEKNPRAKLLLGGDGDIARFQRLVAEHDLTERVELLGWVGPEAKVQTFLNCEIYTLPSYNEGLPGSVLEAMAAGKPIVTTPVGGIPEAVEEGGNGYLVNPGDVDQLAARLEQLCSDSTLRNRMGERSRQIIYDKFESHSLVSRLLTIYTEALTSSGRL